ncbi:FMN-dependent NADH-azoreductase [Paenibacillus sacheonensis]|uniref:FMN dependent NADH:quinone oxidoreductase n=1 Tax=Paenibacillus sacheonensis TaxID=742054 RepID=A0A7X4YMU2_9BACL|nr:FMN-dependent NADH-azoreductase [Paenibacillus sacheonensis]MBM7564719.1 FMN-dependent NADH-azoreductase [Paenibacillus sacheonensis]NBC69275.1 FMN-dependent NADH-azoreductase [Paenibacillus sacheonensis]
MAKLLYITAHPHDHQVSISMAVGQAFIDAYRDSHPQDEIKHLDLYNMNIPHIDADVFSGWGKLRGGSQFTELSSGEQQKVSRLNELVDEFVAGDKYVFVTPMWNFSYPPIMKAYIDSICVAGKTFKYTSEGPVGLLPDKSAIHIQARGGIYSEGPAVGIESGHRHLASIMSFFGITDFSGIFAEGHAAAPDKADAIKAKAIEEAKKAAVSFGSAKVKA